MRHPPEDFYCTTCGGANITSEAYCHWNVDNQCWEFDGVMDEGYDYCNDCSDERTGEFRPVTDVKILALIAIKREESNAATQNA